MQRKFRVAAFDTPSDIALGTYTITADNDEEAAFAEISPDFVEWLSDWAFYEDYSQE